LPINYAQSINELASEINEIAERKGFWEIEGISDFAHIPVKLALIHDEVSEALRVHRDHYDDSEEDPITRLTSVQEDDFTEELADILVRVLDLAGEFDLDIGTSLVEKIETNRGRPRRHGKRY
jgi:NTP pyrophosphatase (non-canonical NTP hydrolase)